MYGGPTASLTPGMVATKYCPAGLPDNICRSMVDTLTSKVAKHRPLPRVLSSHGSYRTQRRARKMTQFLEGVFDEQKVFQGHSANIVRDAGTTGCGLSLVYREGKRIYTERVNANECYVDPYDAEYGKPRNIYRATKVDRGTLMRRVGGSRTKKDAILRATGDLFGHPTTTQSTVRRVSIVEGWHLPEGDEKDGVFDIPGRHTIAVQGEIILDEEFHWDTFPIIELNYSDPVQGWFGTGLIEQVEGYQCELNLANERLSDAYQLTGALLLLPTGADIVESEISNRIGAVVRFNAAGGKPEMMPLTPVNPAFLQRVSDLISRAYQNAGISQMSAMSAKPAGVTAAIAMQTLDDVETERFAVFGRAYETWCVRLGEAYLRLAREIAKEYGDLSVNLTIKSGASPGVMELKWTDIAVDHYSLRVFSASMLPQLPAARLQTLQGFFDAGVIDRTTFLLQLEATDLQGEFDNELADKMLCDEILEKFQDTADNDNADDVYMPPLPQMDLAWSQRRAQMIYCRNKLHGMPRVVEDLLLRFMSDCQQMLKLAQPPAPAPGPDPMGAPPMDAPPMQPPPAAPMPMAA